MDEEKALLERENQALRSMVRAQAIIIKEVFELLPPEFQDLENVQRAIRHAENVIIELGSHLNVKECH